MANTVRAGGAVKGAVVAVVLWALVVAACSDTATNQERTFRVRTEQLAPDDWLTIGLHPTKQPTQIEVSPSAAEACGATLDGKLESCRPLDAAGHGVVLTGSSGEAHLAFAVRSRGVRAGSDLEVSVRYRAADAFVEVIPPSGAPATTVIFIPQSSTVAAQAYRLPAFEAAPDIAVEMTQDGRALNAAAPCDFGSEIDCVGGVTAGRLLTVSVAGGGSDTQVALLVSWA